MVVLVGCGGGGWYMVMGGSVSSICNVFLDR